MKKKPEKFNVSLWCKIRSKRNVVIRTICSYPIKWPLESVSTQTVQTWFYKFESYFQVYNMNYINIQRKSSKLSIEFENYLTLSRTVHIRRKVSAKFLFHCHLILSRAYIKKLFSELLDCFFSKAPLFRKCISKDIISIVKSSSVYSSPGFFKLFGCTSNSVMSITHDHFYSIDST